MSYVLLKLKIQSNNPQIIKLQVSRLKHIMQTSIFFTPQVTREALSIVIFVFEDLYSLSTSDDHKGSSSNHADNQLLFA